MLTPEERLFQAAKSHSPLALIAAPGSEELCKKIDYYLIKWYNEANEDQKETFMINCNCPRFSTGDGKGVIKESVRGLDVYIVIDVGNYSCTYSMFGQLNRMSPDDHYANLKRIISAIGGKCARLSVIMPTLYGGRQHKRNMRESLDGAMMLQELSAMGVKDIITFDAHDPRVQNAVPLMGFDNFMPTYQVLKALLRKFPDIKLDKNNFMVVSPDEGAMYRNKYYSSFLGVDLGMYYKRRDYTTVVNGRNPIVAHEYLGGPTMGMDIFVADDIIASGESSLGLAHDLKSAGANRIFLSTTYALFTEGIEKFRKAYEDGIITAVIGTNLTYTRPELLDEEWYVEADMSKYIAYIVAACNQERSISAVIDPSAKIHKLITNFKQK